MSTEGTLIKTTVLRTTTSIVICSSPRSGNHGDCRTLLPWRRGEVIIVTISSDAVRDITGIVILSSNTGGETNREFKIFKFVFKF